jgi:hypothetical protein
LQVPVSLMLSMGALLYALCVSHCCLCHTGVYKRLCSKVLHALNSLAWQLSIQARAPRPSNTL